MFKGQTTVEGFKNGAQCVYFRFSSPAEWMDYFASTFPNTFGGSIVHSAGKTEFLPKIRETGKSKIALKDFQEAKAHIQRPLIKGAKQTPAVSGGAWVIPAFLAGQPMCARTRAPHKLPPLNVKVRLNTASSFSTEEINRAAAKLARGLWEYKLAGGIVTLSLWYFSQGETAPFRLDCNIPITSEASLAFALSAHSYRSLYIDHAQKEVGHLANPPKAMDPDVLWLTPPGVDARLKAFGLLHEGEQ